jgi:D-arabinose 1-dehydrogenase-like Zn-dependent alcohol dehydrogenase
VKEQIMRDTVEEYKQANAPLPRRQRLWPLYGAGFEKLGRSGQMIEVDLPAYGPDELLVRHDACGICFSDIKVIRAGQNHPRIYRDMSKEPVVLGHEVSLTIVGVGEHLRDQYNVGDRFIVQADIYINGVGYAYGYEIQGGFSQYNVVDQRVLNGDGGNYLLAVRPVTGYAEAALNEPWACVEASYNVVYRTQWREGGTVWLVGDGSSMRMGRAQNWRAARVVLDVQDRNLAGQARAWASSVGAEIISNSDGQTFDDIVVMSNDPDLIERAFGRLAKGGVFNVVTREPVSRRVQLDIGRLHYDNLAVVGAANDDLSAAYTPIRTQLRPGGLLWVLGAAGPMGQMHLQRALEIAGKPRKIVATNLHLARLSAVAEKFDQVAQEEGVELVCLSQEMFENGEQMAERLRAETGGQGFDDIAVMAPSVQAIEDAMEHLADNSVMNVFAGLTRGTMAAFDINAVVQRHVRFTGTSGSSIEDLRHMRDLTERHALSPNRSVVAVAGLEGVPDGLHAVAEGRFPGKVVIFPNLSKPLPLTTLAEMEEKLPSVYARLEDGQTWTAEAEAELLRLLL